MSAEPSNSPQPVAYARPSATPRRRKHGPGRYLLIAGIILIIYLAMPIVAGVYEIGNRSGPILYPSDVHAELYLIGWEAAGNEGKPREPFGHPPRPWFYGLD